MDIQFLPEPGFRMMWTFQRPKEQSDLCKNSVYLLSKGRYSQCTRDDKSQMMADHFFESWGACVCECACVWNMTQLKKCRFVWNTSSSFCFLQRLHANKHPTKDITNVSRWKLWNDKNAKQKKTRKLLGKTVWPLYMENKQPYDHSLSSAHGFAFHLVHFACANKVCVPICKVHKGDSKKRNLRKKMRIKIWVPATHKLFLLIRTPDSRGGVPKDPSISTKDQKAQNTHPLVGARKLFP